MRMWLATGTYKKLRDQRQPQADVPIQKTNQLEPSRCVRENAGSVQTVTRPQFSHT